MSKIQKFESESQPIELDPFYQDCCLSCQRYKNLKANHNAIRLISSNVLVVYHVKDTKI